MESWDPVQRKLIVDMQYRAQQASYRLMYPQAEQRLILLDGVSAGQIIVSRSRDEIRFVDIAVHPSCQRKGLAKAAVAAVIEEAMRDLLPIRLQILRTNARSHALASTMGFQLYDESDSYWFMEYTVVHS